MQWQEEGSSVNSYRRCQEEDSSSATCGQTEERAARAPFRLSVDGCQPSKEQRPTTREGSILLWCTLEWPTMRAPPPGTTLSRMTWGDQERCICWRMRLGNHRHSIYGQRGRLACPTRTAAGPATNGFSRRGGAIAGGLGVVRAHIHSNAWQQQTWSFEVPGRQ